MYSFDWPFPLLEWKLTNVCMLFSSLELLYNFYLGNQRQVTLAFKAAEKYPLGDFFRQF